MSSFQSAVGLPPLSALAANDQNPRTVSSSNIGNAATANSTTAVEYRDARIKDPIPKKLKGHTGNLSGNFGIIQLDLGGHESPLERDEIAKRASESTELAAIRAYQSGHGVSSTKRFVRVPDDTGVWDSYSTAAPATTRPSVLSVSPTLPQPLTPADVKAEQSRLLTLLRGIPATSVVDQICKALSYFGGVPGAAPPSDGTFPKSELANGSGGAFVGWISEIFPKLPNTKLSTVKSARQPSLVGLSTLVSDAVDEADARHDAAVQADANSKPSLAPTGQISGSEQLEAVAKDTSAPAEKRRRGRPKGSKATKARRDKGIKKGPIKDRKALALAAAAAATPAFQTLSSPQVHHPGLQAPPVSSSRHGEDSWVDVDDDNMLDVSATVGDGLFFPPDTNTSLTADAGLSLELDARQITANGDSSAVPNQHTTETGKKRGRPKGSKNRPKAPAAEPLHETSSGPISITPIPPPAVPNNPTSQKKPKSKKQNAPSAKDFAGFAKAARNPAQPEARRDAQVTEALHLQGAYDLQNPTSDTRQVLSIPPDGTPATTGGKRKRTKASKQSSQSTDPSQAASILSQGGGSLTTQQTDLAHGVLGPSKKQKQRRLGDSNVSVQGSIDGSASPVPGIASGNSAGAFVQGDTSSLDTGTSMIPPLDSNSGEDGGFNAAAAFEALSSHLEQETPVTLPGQHQQNHSNELSSLQPSLHGQQLQAQNRQSMQQPSLVSQKTLSLTPPFRPTERLQSMGTAAQQGHQHRPHQLSNRGQSAQQVQQLHTQHNMSNHVGSSTHSQPNSQTHMAAALPTGSLTVQQLPRPNRASQTYYAQNRASSATQFSLALPQPPQSQPHQNQHQNQHHAQQQQKQHFPPQYQSEGSYSSQTQQHQTFATQQRQPSQPTSSSSPNLLAHNNAHRSPQFTASATTSMRSEGGSYNTGAPAGAMSFNPPSYDQSRRQSSASSASLGHAYGAAGTTAHPLGHQGAASFVSGRQQHSPSVSHSQGVGGVAQGIQGFHGFDGPSLFDGISLDTAGSGGGLGLSGSTTYNLGGGVPRTSGSVGAFGSSPSTNSFDATNLGRDRFYDIRR